MTNVAYADLIFLKWSVDNILETLQILYWFLEIRNKSSCHISDCSFTKDDLDMYMQRDSIIGGPETAIIL